MKSTSIKELVSAVVDTGRRGHPKAGCDCLACFGYCMVDREVADREAMTRQIDTVRRDYDNAAPL